MGVSLGKATVRVGVAAIKGDAIFVTDLTREARMAKCKVCPHVLKVEVRGRLFHRCTACARCWLDGDYLKKASLATEQCPHDFWPKEGK